MATLVSEVTAEAALARMGATERAAVEEFRRQVADLLGRLRDLRLFGSQARGEPHDESDIDLLVLVDGGDTLAARDPIFQLAYRIDPRLAPHVRDFEAYHEPKSRATGFYREMRAESVRL